MTTTLSSLANQQQNLRSEMPVPEKLQVLRDFGKTQFEKLGLPHRKQEDWHYTSVKELAQLDFELGVLVRHGLVSRQDLRHDQVDFYNLIFINGKLDRLLSDWDQLRAEVGVEELTVAPQFEGSKAEVRQAPELKPFEALNLSYYQQGLMIDVPAGVSVSRPIQIMNVVTESRLMCHPRFLIKLGARAKLSLIESYSSHNSRSLQNSVTEIELDDSAKIEYLRLQDEHRGSFNIGLTKVKLFENSCLEALSFTVGAKLGRHDLEVAMQGPQSTARVQGLTLASGDQHLDHNTLIDHVVGSCSTSQLYKSVLNHQARSVFTGMVKIRQGSQKASSDQLNNSLLLSRDAEADSRPQLEILADDVKATHGSTVGQLNPEELFYLLSRAIPREQALEMLSLGFVQDLVFQISHPQIQTWMGQVLSQSYKAAKQDFAGALS